MAMLGAGAARAAAMRVFSGIQPTGIPHLGNFIGALRNWRLLQAEAAARGDGRSSVLYCIVDLHAMTMPFDAQRMSDACMTTAAVLMATGVDPQQSILYRQSDVREHAELAWILSCVTPMGWLNRMTQYKQKSGKEREKSVLGLLSYPVLQAADILLYKATHVPVGEDQLQHLELARDIATTFNHKFCGGGAGEGDAVGAAASVAAPTFPLPSTVFPPGATGSRRIMSLKDASKKMSKSDKESGAAIFLTDDADTIRATIRAAKTDSTTGFAPYDPEARPEKANLLNIYSALSGEAPEALAERFAASSAVEFKTALTEVVVSTITPIGDEVRRLLADRSHLAAVLGSGGDAARDIAAQTMREVRQVAGLGALR